MPPIVKIKLIEDYRNLEKNLEIKLKDITLLVGEQGCGKSSLLELLQSNKLDLTLTAKVKEKGIQSFYFDTEKMNPRIRDPNLYTTPTGGDKGIGFSGALSSRFKSHGEILREFTVNRISSAKDAVVILDEPESGLSLKNQYKLAREMKNVIGNNVQFICATHCLPLILEIGEVYNLESKRWEKSHEFVESSRSADENHTMKITQVLQNEFRSMAEMRRAFGLNAITVNGKIANKETVVEDGDIVKIGRDRKFMWHFPTNLTD